MAGSCGLGASAQNGDQWWALVNMEMNIRVPLKAENFLRAEWVLAYKEGLYFMELLG